MGNVSVNRHVGQTVHLIMWRRGLSQKDLAGRLGLTQQAVSRKLRAQRAFGIDELLDVAAWLDVPVTDLLPREDSNLQPTGYGNPLVAARLALAA